jgi:sugar phosphate isomerase/epimerase
MIIPGLVSITFRPLSPEEVISLVVKAKLGAIEWGGDVHVPHGDLQRAAEVRRQTGEAGLAVSAYGSYYRLGDGEGKGPSFERVLETAVALGAPTIRVWAGGAGSKDTDEQTRSLVVSESRRIAEAASREGISVSYEYHGGTLTDTNESAAALLEEAGHPNLLTFWQPPNGASFDYCLAGLRRLLRLVTNIHVFHWWPTAADRRPLAEGAERWQPYLETIQAGGRDHFASLEFVRGDSAEAFMEDASTLLSWLESL